MSKQQQSGNATHEALLMKLEELDAYTYTILMQFPKAERFLLCSDIKICMSNILRLTVTCWKRYHKKTTLSDLDVEIEVLRMLIRKAHRLKFITDKRYEVWSLHVNEIGRMVGGWIKYINSTQP